MNEEKKYHYYAFSFIGKSIEPEIYPKQVRINASLYWGLENNRVTLKNITKAKELAGVDDDAVLISLCYMGHMTSNEVNENEVKNVATAD